MSRVVVIGNAGGGKSTLARLLADARRLRHFEIDCLLWQKDWRLTPTDVYERQHAEIIAGEDWLIDGLGRQASIAVRIARATEVILVDMPLWMHFWLAAERQIAWKLGSLLHAPAGIKEMPPTQELFRTIWEVEHIWMPEIRALCVEAEQHGKRVTTLTSVEALDAFARSVKDRAHVRNS